MGRIGLDYARKNPNVVFAIIDTEKIGTGLPPLEVTSAHAGGRGRRQSSSPRSSRRAAAGQSGPEGKRCPAVSIVDGQAISQQRDTRRPAPPAQGRRQGEDRLTSAGPRRKRVELTLVAAPGAGRAACSQSRLLWRRRRGEALIVTEMIEGRPGDQGRAEVRRPGDSHRRQAGRGIHSLTRQDCAEPQGRRQDDAADHARHGEEGDRGHAGRHAASALWRRSRSPGQAQAAQRRRVGRPTRERTGSAGSGRLPDRRRLQIDRRRRNVEAREQLQSAAHVLLADSRRSDRRRR